MTWHFYPVLTPQLAPHSVGKIISLSACDNGYGVKNSAASVASYPALTFFLKKVLFILCAEVEHSFNLNKLTDVYDLVVPTFHALDV